MGCAHGGQVSPNERITTVSHNQKISHLAPPKILAWKANKNWKFHYWASKHFKNLEHILTSNECWEHELINMHLKKYASNKLKNLPLLRREWDYFNKGNTKKFNLPNCGMLYIPWLITWKRHILTYMLKSQFLAEIHLLAIYMFSCILSQLWCLMECDQRWPGKIHHTRHGSNRDSLSFWHIHSAKQRTNLISIDVYRWYSSWIPYCFRRWRQPTSFGARCDAKT